MRTFQIPIVSRGRIIMPGEDALEFPGRAGATFRCPDPHKHVHDLVLANTDRMSDLQAMPVREILDFLAAAGPRMTMDNPYLAEAFELSRHAGGLTEPVLRGIYDYLPGLFDRSFLETMVERTVGSDYLDGWVSQGSGQVSSFRVRAVGTRNLHITAGNVPIVGAMTILQSVLTKSDCLIKLPSNDPLSATAVARTLIDMDPDHPAVKHIAVAYWKGGDEVMESQICRLGRIDKITAWGGQASMKHIQKFLVPGLDFIALNPKISMSIVGREAFDSAEAMREAAEGIALQVGRTNQSACANTRVVYVESEADDAAIEKVIALGEEVYAALQRLPERVSTQADRPNPELEAELRAIALEEELYWTKGNTITGGVIVSRFPDRVDFYPQLINRIVNLVPMPDITQVLRWCDDSTQTVGVYPESLRHALRDRLALAGVQYILPLREATASVDDRRMFAGLPHDGIEQMRRMVRWVVEEAEAQPHELQQAAE
jgi:hypothetical protein